MVTQGLLSQGLQLPLPLMVLLIGGIASPLIGLLWERAKIPRLREGWMFVVAAAALGSVYLLFEELKVAPDNIIVMKLWGQRPPLGGCFEIDMLSIFMSGSIAFLGLLVSIYSISYMEKESRLTEFYTLVTFMLAGMTGIVMAGDFFTLFIFWELMGLSSYVLVAFSTQTAGYIDPLPHSIVMMALVLDGTVIAVGLAMVLNVYRHYKTIDIRKLRRLKW